MELKPTTSVHAPTMFDLSGALRTMIAALVLALIIMASYVGVMAVLTFIGSIP